MIYREAGDQFHNSAFSFSMSSAELGWMIFTVLEFIVKGKIQFCYVGLEPIP
jgi:hypothetical protein